MAHPRSKNTVTKNRDGEEVVRHDMKNVPKRIYDALDERLTTLKLKTGVAVTMREATVRGMELALDELAQIRNPDEYKRLYRKG